MNDVPERRPVEIISHTWWGPTSKRASGSDTRRTRRIGRVSVPRGWRTSVVTIIRVTSGRRGSVTTRGVSWRTIIRRVEARAIVRTRGWRRRWWAPHPIVIIITTCRRTSRVVAIVPGR